MDLRRMARSPVGHAAALCRGGGTDWPEPSVERSMVIDPSVLDGPRFLRHLHSDRQPLPGDRIACTREQSRAASDRS